MIKPDLYFAIDVGANATNIISESNIESQIFDNSPEIPEGEGNGKLFGPILTVIALVTIIGLSVYLINRYEEEEKMKTI